MPLLSVTGRAWKYQNSALWDTIDQTWYDTLTFASSPDSVLAAVMAAEASVDLGGRRIIKKKTAAVAAGSEASSPAAGVSAAAASPVAVMAGSETQKNAVAYCIQHISWKQNELALQEYCQSYATI